MSWIAVFTSSSHSILILLVSSLCSASFLVFHISFVIFHILFESWPNQTLGLLRVPLKNSVCKLDQSQYHIPHIIIWWPRSHCNCALHLVSRCCIFSLEDFIPVCAAQIISSIAWLMDRLHCFVIHSSIHPDLPCLYRMYHLSS